MSRVFRCFLVLYVAEGLVGGGKWAIDEDAQITFQQNRPSLFILEGETRITKHYLPLLSHFRRNR